ncbi:hypothetical protein PG996_013344 [Apiospora saccharicola]|uniref:Uncharacterized protein n=1 Tax=Apiospora saccharicola TaxID=335842 RepID=A0ABR1U579_9PEZI
MFSVGHNHARITKPTWKRNKGWFSAQRPPNASLIVDILLVGVLTFDLAVPDGHEPRPERGPVERGVDVHQPVRQGVFHDARRVPVFVFFVEVLVRCVQDGRAPQGGLAIAAGSLAEAAGARVVFIFGRRVSSVAVLVVVIAGRRVSVVVLLVAVGTGPCMVHIEDGLKSHEGAIVFLIGARLKNTHAAFGPFQDRVAFVPAGMHRTNPVFTHLG